MSQVTDLTAILDVAGDGVHWTLHEGGDLNANLVRLEPGHAIDAHVNDEVDVLLVVLAGSGELTVDRDRRQLGRGTVAHISKGSRRHLRAASDGLGYLTVHRRRRGPSIRPNPNR